MQTNTPSNPQMRMWATVVHVRHGQLAFYLLPQHLCYSSLLPHLNSWNNVSKACTRKQQQAYLGIVAKTF